MIVTENGYEKKIDRLTSKAEKVANNSIKMEDFTERDQWAAEWNRVYLDTMDMLAAEAGLRGSRKYRRAN